MALTAALVGVGLAAVPSAGQDDGVRLGLRLGGNAFLSFLVEYRWEDWGVDLSVGSWSFRDLSLAATGRHYLGAGSSRPYLGLGLWALRADEGDGPSTAVILRAPVGGEWTPGGRHSFALEISINRVLVVDRAGAGTGEGEIIESEGRFVPLPALEYRWGG